MKNTLLSLLVLGLFALPAKSQTEQPTFSTGGPTITGGTVTPSPDSTVYDGPSRGVNKGEIIQDAGPLLEQTVSGVPISSVFSGALSRSEKYLPDQYAKVASDVSPYLSSILSGGNINYGSVLGTASPYLTDLLGGDAAEVYGEYGQYLEGLLNGNTDTGSLIRAGTGILSKIFAGNSTFGTAAGILGGLFGGGGGSIDLEKPLDAVFSDPVTTALGQLVFSGSAGDQKAGTAQSGQILADTGTVLCLYNPTCSRSNPQEYRSLLSNSLGAMGFSNPNEVRGQIGALSRAGVRPDSFSSRYSSEQNTYYMGAKYNSEIARSRTDVFLSKAGQAAQQKAIDSARETAKNLTKMSDKCDKDAKASQDLIRCNMKLNTATASFEAANLTAQIQGQVNDSLANNLLSDISEAVTKDTRLKNVERSAYSSRLFQDAAVKLPTTR